VTDTNGTFYTTIANNSTQAFPLQSVRFSLTPTASVVDTFGSSSVPITTTPSIGGNNAGGSANVVVLAPNSPLMPGQMFTTSNGDIDGGNPTAIAIQLTYGDGTTIDGALTLAGDTWSGSFQKATVPMYPITLDWVPPTENTDGSPYTDPKGYKIYWGSQAGTYANSAEINDPNIVTHTVQVPQGQWYFVATAINLQDRESEYSNVATGNAGPTPLPPDAELELPPGAVANGLAYTVFTVRGQIVFVEIGTVDPDSACDPQAVRGLSPDGVTLMVAHIVNNDAVNLLPSVPNSEELAAFAVCQ
jgi:hypothetical protein